MAGRFIEILETHYPCSLESILTENGEESLNNFYSRPLVSKRTGAIYSAFPYPTKISPETSALFIAAHTKPGDTVFDGFGGSGMTGIGAMICSDPSDQLKQQANDLGLNPAWGPRKAIVYELGALGAHISKVLSNPPDPEKFRLAASEILNEASCDNGWMYATKDELGQSGEIRHVVWSEILSCNHCGSQISTWDACVSLSPANISTKFDCPHCQNSTSVDKSERVTNLEWDEILLTSRIVRSRRPMKIYGRTGTRNWSRSVSEDDLTLLERISDEPLPENIPNVPIPWGDLYRRGYHTGITHLHHFYSRRNLIAFARLWSHIGRYDEGLQESLKFWLLSYNSSHATIMTRIVAKSGADDLVVTSCQPGVLYVSGLPVEKNLYLGLKRKLATIFTAFNEIAKLEKGTSVVHRSTLDVDLPDESVDFIFTDPPFGGNIPYSEVNFLNEVWLDQRTDTNDEIIVSRHQNKGVDDYENLLQNAFGEMHRILKPEGKAAVVFHSSSASVWSAFQRAAENAGFIIERTNVLDKEQASFKQVQTQGAVRGDVIFLFGKSNQIVCVPESPTWDLVAARLVTEASAVPEIAELTPQRLYSRLVSYFLSRHQKVPVNASSFYKWLNQERTGQSIDRHAI